MVIPSCQESGGRAVDTASGGTDKGLYWLWQMCPKLSAADYTGREPQGKDWPGRMYPLLLLSRDVSGESHRHQKLSSIPHLTHKRQKQKGLGSRGISSKSPWSRPQPRNPRYLAGGSQFYLLISTPPLRRANAKHWNWVEEPTQPFPKFCNLVNLCTVSWFLKY